MSVINLITNWDFSLGMAEWARVYSSYPGPNDIDGVISTSNAYTGDRCARLTRTDTGTNRIYQIVDKDEDIYNQKFEIGGWIKINTLDSGGAVRLYYEWLDSAGDVIGSEVVIANLTATQSYTLHSTDGTAPVNAEQIKFYFETTGGASIDVIAYLDNVYIYGPKDYGLKVLNSSGDSSIVISDVSSIIAAGTVSMPNTLESDDTYGVDIDLPGDDYIDADNIGVIIQVRDFDWKLVVNILTYATGDNFWGNFFGDDAITYYEKKDDGVMISWSAGNMTPGTQSTYNPLVNMDLVAGWDRFATGVKKVRLFAALFYTFLKSVIAGTITSTLYAKDYALTVNGVSGYALSTTQGAIEQMYGIESGGDIFFNGPVTDFDISIVHADGSETSLAEGVAEDDRGGAWGGGSGDEGQYDATWELTDDTVIALTDSLKFVLNVWVQFVDMNLTIFTHSFSITYTTTHLGSTLLKAKTWTLYRYIKGYRTGNWGRGNGFLEIYWGTSSKEVKVTNVEYSTSSSSAQRVCSIGENGVSEVDYMIYLKNYDGK